MEKVKLVETKIQNLRGFNWIEYFKYNNLHLLKLDFNNNAELSKNKIFEMDLEDNQMLEEAINYGISLGIPRKELNYRSINIKNKVRSNYIYMLNVPRRIENIIQEFIDNFEAWSDVKPFYINIIKEGIVLVGEKD